MCDDMQEWDEVEEAVEQVLEEIPEIPATKEEVLEEIHEEGHRLMDFEKRLTGKPNLKKVEMAPLLLKASENVLARLRQTKRLPLRQTLAGGHSHVH